MFNILIDSGYWIALLDPTDDPKRTTQAEEIEKDIEDENLLLPFPTLYEFVNSRLSRRKEAVQAFEKICLKPNVKLLQDEVYKEIAFENFFKQSKMSISDISLVDEVLKLIMADVDWKIDYLVSFDSGLLNAASSIGIKQI